MYLDNEVIREMRLDRGWTQQQLADACGISMRTVQRVEKDGTASLETTSALGSVFEVERRTLLRVSASEEVGTAHAGSMKLVLLGVLVGIVVGVLATLAFMSADVGTGQLGLLPENQEWTEQRILICEVERVNGIEPSS